MLNEASPPAVETMAERHGRLLGRLAELSLAACEDLAARAAEAEEPKLAADLHGAFAKAGRCLRQTVMLEAKLAAMPAARPSPPTPVATGWTPRPRAPRQWIDREKLAEQLEGLDLERLDSLDEDFEPEPDAPQPPRPVFRDPIPDPVFDESEPEPEPPPPPPPPAHAADYDFLDRVIEKSRYRGSDGPWSSG